MGGAILKQAVKVQAGALVAELIVHIDHKVVSYRGSDLRNRPLAVNPNGGTVESAVRVRCYPCDIEIVGNSSGANKRAKKKESKSAEDDVQGWRSHWMRD